MNPLPYDEACATRILCTVNFHFDSRRFGFLAEVLRSLSEFPVAALKVIIVTNSVNEQELAPLRRLCGEMLPDKNATVRSYPGLANPFDLTWCHKGIIANEFVGAGDGQYTHFIYIEDDTRLTFANFCYFVEFREALREVGLLPSFVRTEWRTAVDGLVATDVFWPIYVPLQAHVQLGEAVLVNLPNPHNACIILDRELAEEYASSRSFDHARSREVCRWEVRERAIMGLCFEHVPPGFQSRFAVAVSTRTGALLPSARLSHLPNNYANNPLMTLGKVRIDSLFSGVRNLINGNWWPSRRSLPTASQNHQSLPGDCYYLISHHDTVLFVDEATQYPRHGPFGIAPLNLVLRLTDQHAELIFLDTDAAGHRKLSFASANAEITWLPEDAAPTFQVENISDGSIGLRSGGFYLAADPNGLVHSDRTWCRGYEQFRLMRVDTVAGLDILQRHSWVSQRDGKTVRLLPQPIDFGQVIPSEASALAASLVSGAIELRRELVFGPARIRLTATVPQITFTDPDDPRESFITEINGTTHAFSRE